MSEESIKIVILDQYILHSTRKKDSKKHVYIV